MSESSDSLDRRGKSYVALLLFCTSYKRSPKNNSASHTVLLFNGGSETCSEDKFKRFVTFFFFNLRFFFLISYFSLCSKCDYHKKLFLDIV